MSILEFLNSLANFFLILDDFCEELFNDRIFLSWQLHGVTITLFFLYKAQPLSTEQVVLYNRLHERATICSNQLTMI